MRVLIAIGVSVFVHLILAAGLWWYLSDVPEPAVLARLDLSSVELSFAQEDAPSAMPVDSLPVETSAPRPRTKVENLPVPVPDAVDPALPALEEPRPPEVQADIPELPALPAVAPRQARVEAPPKPRCAIRPDYPRGARLRKEEGDVTLEIHVDETGDVNEVRIISGSGFPELDEAAVRAAKAACFTPAKSGHENVASVARLKLTFKLK